MKLKISAPNLEPSLDFPSLEIEIDGVRPPQISEVIILAGLSIIAREQPDELRKQWIKLGWEPAPE